MNILLLSRAPLNYKAGIPCFVKSLYSSISDNNIISISPSFNLFSSFKAKSISHTSVLKEYIYPSFARFGTVFFSPQYYFAGIVFSRRSHIIHYQHPDPLSAFLILVIRLLHPYKKIVVTWHAEIYQAYFIFAPFLFIVDTCVFLFASKIIYPSHAHQQSSFLYKLNFVRHKSSIIPLASQVPTNISFERVFTNTQIRVVSVGRLVSYKGYEYAITAFKYLPDNFSYTIIGSGPLYSKLNKLINQLGLSAKVTISSKIDDDEKFSYLQDSDIFLFPSISQSEAFGLSQLEAMHFSLPIINTFLQNGVNELAPDDIALTVLPRSSDLIRDALLYMASSQVRFEYSSKSRKRAMSYTLDSISNEYMKLFASL